mmetsp:Transcript_20107/g.42418  ORF Transcript_20107/g.42418 Transcript_20107/m.42418 type:complete len:652 (+) Transcript_20107:108-2063(+)
MVLPAATATAFATNPADHNNYNITSSSSCPINSTTSTSSSSSVLSIFVDECDPEWFRKLVARLHRDARLHGHVYHQHRDQCDRDCDSSGRSLSYNNDDNHKRNNNSSYFQHVRKLKVVRTRYPPLSWTRKGDTKLMNAFWWGIAFGMPRLEELELHKQHGRWTNLGESLYNLVNVNVNVNDLENVNSNTNATNTATKNTTLFENLRSVSIFADGAPAGAGRNYNNRNYSNNRLWTEDDNSDDSCGVVVGDSVLEFFATRLPRLKSVVVESEALAETASTNTNTNTNTDADANANATEGETAAKEIEIPPKGTKKRIRRVGKTPTRKIPKLNENVVDTDNVNANITGAATVATGAADATTAAVGAAAEVGGVAEGPSATTIVSLAPPDQGVLSKHDEKWYSMFQKLMEYKLRSKHTLVPQCYPDDPRLGRWVHYQRVEYWIFQQKGSAKITEERIARLNAIGFEWDPQKAQWEKMFAKLQEFNKEFSHCRVPKGYDKDWELANWVRNQRLEQANLSKEGKKSRMTPERFKRLDNLGFKWSSPTPARARRNPKPAAGKIASDSKNGEQKEEPKSEETVEAVGAAAVPAAPAIEEIHAEAPAPVAVEEAIVAIATSVADAVAPVIMDANKEAEDPVKTASEGSDTFEPCDAVEI